MARPAETATGTDPPPGAGADAGGLRAIALILLAMLAFTVQDAAVKLVSDQISIWQMQLVRSAAVIALLALFVRWVGGEALIPSRWLWPVLRAVAMCGAYLFYYAALPFLTLSQAAAAFFVGPLLITLFAALLIGEPIGPRRIAAVVVGFLGVLVIVRPGLEGWSPAALMPVAAAVCYALGSVLTRWRCRSEPGFALTFTHNLLYSGIGLLGLVFVPLLPIAPETRAEAPFLLFAWVPIGLVPLVLLLSTAATHMAGMLCSVAAYRGTEASRIAPFEYSYLVIVPVFDLAIWGTWPDDWTFAGMALILASGTYVAWREGRPARPRVQFRGEVPWTPDHGDGKGGA
ncbi:MAG: DMT family transporter [Pseudomonadota bacterium]